MRAEKRLHEHIPHILTIGEFVKNKSCLFVEPKTTLYDVVIAMRENHNYAALVMDRHELVGLLTEHRTLLYLISELSAPTQSIEKVTKAFNVLVAADVMIKHPETLDADIPADTAFDTMTERGFRYMPVLKKKHPVGILNRSEIIRHLQEKSRKELESKDMMLSYLMHHENYGCL